MWFWILTLAVKAEILGKSMNERSLMRLHRLEAEAFFCIICREDSKFSLILLAKLLMICEEGEGRRRVWDVVIRMSCGVDIESWCKLGVTLQPQTFLIAVQSLLRIARRRFRG